ncbi:MAG: RNA-directed DNA polymerase [Acidobacteria bacterium]|nr:RNA-directed DNA polymerase [Acidobacteriota bacterium]
MYPFLTAAALRSAFIRVAENHGAAGSDGVSVPAFQRDLESSLVALRESVLDGDYFAWPLRQVVIEKRPGSAHTRTLLVPAVADRVLQTAVARYLEPLVEAELEDCSFGYRRGRGVLHAVRRVRQRYLEGYRWLLDADIHDFFSSVDRDLVVSRLAPLVPDELALRLVRLWLDYAVWDGLRLQRPDLGLPLGSVISPLLANLCLDALDEALLGAGLQIVRYADDFVVLAKSRKQAALAREVSEQTLASLELRLHPEKTAIVRYDDGFKFLGVVFMKDLLLQPLRTGGPKRLRVLHSARSLPESFFPEKEKRRLRRYNAW